MGFIRRSMPMTEAKTGGPRPFKKPEWQPRLMVILNSLRPGKKEEAALHALGPALADCYAGARARYCVTGEESALSRSLVEFRGYELVQAVAELTWPVGTPIEEVDWALESLRKVTGDAARVRTLIAGEVTALLDDP